MATLHIEKVGGLAGFGGTNARIRSRGQLDMEALSPDDQQAVEALFRSRGGHQRSQMADGFRFRLSRTTAAGTETVEIPEEDVPAALASSVRDDFV